MVEVFRDFFRIGGAASGLYGAAHLLAQAAQAGHGWGDATTPVTVGVTGMIVAKLLDGWIAIHRARVERQAAADAATAARDVRAAELESRLDNSRRACAAARAELDVWKRRCTNPPTDRDVQAALKRARERPGDYADDLY